MENEAILRRIGEVKSKLALALEEGAAAVKASSEVREDTLLLVLATTLTALGDFHVDIATSSIKRHLATITQLSTGGVTVDDVTSGRFGPAKLSLVPEEDK